MFRRSGSSRTSCRSARRSAPACRLARRSSATRSRRRSYGDHGSTYGGTLACGAALCFLNRLTDGGVLENVRRVGRFFDERLHALAAKHAFIKDVRGVGLIWGLELSRDAAPVVQAGLANGVIVNRTAETVVRLLPPLNITKEEATEALGRLDAALAAAGAAV